MKTIVLKISIVFLLLRLIGVGCEKEKNDYDPNSIIGEWKLLYTLGGFAGTTYPQEGHNETLEFTEDSILIVRDNEKITFETHFNISGDTLRYHQGTDLEYKIKFSGDTLNLLPVSMGPFSYTFKRIN